MPSREEIREGIDRILSRLQRDFSSISEAKKELSNLGVVIKVDRELPNISPAVECATKLGVFHITQLDMLKAGYEAVEEIWTNVE